MQQIADWLEKLGMSESAQRFAENRIDFSVLRDLTDQDLKDLGVVLGDRRKILRAIADLNDVSETATSRLRPASTPSVAEMPPPPVAEASGEPRHVTVMFCDLVDSTGIAAKLDAEEWRDLVGAYIDAFADELIRLKVSVIATSATPPTIAAKRATSVIPIVFATSGDPVGSGLVASLARPGGNVTGLSIQSVDAVSKQVELLRDVVPNLHRLAVFANESNPMNRRQAEEVQAAAHALGLEVAPLDVRRADDIPPAFAALDGRADALYVAADPLFFNNILTISALALKARLPDMYSFREEVVAGGLLSYGASFPDLFRRAAELVDKILRGAKPADIPVEQPTKFDLVINLKTAKALGLTVPHNLLVLADEVIE